MAASIVYIAVLLTTVRLIGTHSDSFYPSTLYACQKDTPIHRLYRYRPTRCSDTRILISLTLLLAGDIHLNPGPINKNASVYPCGLCEHPVSWNCHAVCCDGCDVWHHKSCIELCSADFELLQRSHVQWMCCKCDSINVDSFTFHSYDLDPNYYSPIQDQNITLESVGSVFSPLKASSPA